MEWLSSVEGCEYLKKRGMVLQKSQCSRMVAGGNDLDSNASLQIVKLGFGMLNDLL